MSPLRTMVTFKSAAFNTSEEKAGFINEGNFGDDVARYLMDGLRRAGVEVPEYLGQEDHGWFFTYCVAGAEHDFIVGWADGEWMGWVERRAGLLGSLFGARKRGIMPEALSAIHAVLKGAPEVSDVLWHDPKAFQAGRWDEGTTEPIS